MKDLQPILSKTLKQDPSKHQVGNKDKLYKRKDVYKERKETTHKGEETYIIIIIIIIYIYIYIY